MASYLIRIKFLKIHEDYVFLIIKNKIKLPSTEAKAYTKMLKIILNWRKYFNVEETFSIQILEYELL